MKHVAQELNTILFFNFQFMVSVLFSAAQWQPKVLDVNPDWQMVNVTFDLAPEDYKFDKYCVSLKNMANNETTQQKDVIPVCMNQGS